MVHHIVTPGLFSFDVLDAFVQPLVQTAEVQRSLVELLALGNLDG